MNCKGTASATGAVAGTPDSLNNITDVDDDNDAGIIDLDAAPSDAALAFEASKAAASSAAMDFIFGSPSAATLSNTNGKHSASDGPVLVDADGNSVLGTAADAPTDGNIGDFGPETDVDAIDEPFAAAKASLARNPLQAEHEQFFSEFTTPALSKNNGDADNAVTDIDADDDANSAPSASLSPQSNPFAASDDVGQHFAETNLDNKYASGVDADVEQFIIDDGTETKRIDADSPMAVDGGDNDVDEHSGAVSDTAVISSKRFAASSDFSEKKEFSFECEEYEKEIDSLADLQSAMHESEQLTSPVTTEPATTEEGIASPATPSPLDSSAEDEEGRIVESHTDAAPATVQALTVEDLAALTASDDEDEHVPHGDDAEAHSLDAFAVPVPAENGKRSVEFYNGDGFRLDVDFVARKLLSFRMQNA